MIRSPAIAATSSRGGSKNCTRIEGVRCKRLAKVRCRSVLASDQPIHLTSKTITAVSIPRSIPSSVHSPRLRFRSRRSRRLHRFHCSKAGPFCMCSTASGPLGLHRKGFDAARSCLRLSFGTPLWRVPIVAIYRPKTRAECRGTSPEAGIEWSTGSETHEIPSVARPCRRPPH
jgi:hypothetical protein